jgi:hypothetical protein
MKSLASFMVGFVAGWGVRSVFDSGRNIVVAMAASGYRVADKARRYAVYEREYVEDVLDEAKAKWRSAKERAREASSQG